MCVSPAGIALTPLHHASLQETDRRCTDIFCLLLFVVFLAGMFVIAGIAYSQGDYRRVLNGIDYRGCTCGSPSKLGTDGVCTDSSSSTGTGVFTPGGFSLIAVPVSDLSSPDLSGKSAIMCAPSCPTSGVTSGSSVGVQLACYTASHELRFMTGTTYSQQVNDAHVNCPGTVFATTAPSHSIAGYCLPQGATAKNFSSTFQTAVDTALGSGTWSTAVDSINQGKWVMVGLACGSILIAFLYLLVIYRCARPITTLAIIAVQALLVAGGALFLVQANNIAKNLHNDVYASYSVDTNWQLNFYGGIAIEVVAALYLCIMVFMWKRIFIAIDLIQLAGHVLQDAWGVVFFPLFTVILTVGVTVAWCITTVLMFSLGEIKPVEIPGVPSGTARTFVLNDSMRYALLYHLFGLFWVTQFLSAVCEMTIAFVATHWLFTPREGGKKHIKPHATLFAFNTVLRYHLGTAAFGAAIIAIIKFIRAIIEYVQHRVKKAGKKSVFINAVLCCCRCCFWCLECCMRFVNRNAYAVVALTKQGFCASAATAFSLLAGNLAQVGAVAGVSTVFLFLGKLFVASVTSGIGYFIFTLVPAFSDVNSPTAVQSPFWPCLVLFVAAYIVGSMFMSVYAVTIDATLMCFVFDKGHGLMDKTTATEIQSLNENAIRNGVENSYASSPDGEVGEKVITPSGGRPTYS
jgi:hypothetical protein